MCLFCCLGGWCRWGVGHNHFYRVDQMSAVLWGYSPALLLLWSWGRGFAGSSANTGVMLLEDWSLPHLLHSDLCSWAHCKSQNQLQIKGQIHEFASAALAVWNSCKFGFYVLVALPLKAFLNGLRLTLNFKVLTNLALQIPPWATWLLFNNFENKGNSLGEKNCAKVNNVLEHASVEFEQKLYSSNLEL